MSKLLFWKYPYYTHYVAAAITGIAIALLFSYSQGLSIVFEEEQRWQYDDLYAPKPILLPLSEKTIDSLSKNSADYTPIFKYNQTVLEEKLKIFEKDFNYELNLIKKDNSFPDVIKFSNTYLQFGQSLLKKIYEKGVARDKIAAKNVKVNRGDLMTEIGATEVFTIKSANDFITDSLPYSNLREPEFLYNILEKKITANLEFDEDANASALKNIRQTLENHRDTIKQGDLIVKKGKKITPAIFQKLTAYKAQAAPSLFSESLPMRFLLFGLFSVFCLFILTTYTIIYQPRYLIDNRIWNTTLLMIFIINVLHFFFLKSEYLHPLLTPYLAIPMLLRRKLNAHWISVTHIICAIIGSQITPVPYSFVVANIVAGLFIIYVKTFEQKAFGKIWLVGASLSILAFVFYTLTVQQNISFDPLSILYFIILQGVLIVCSIFLEQKINFEEKKE
jgi:membrane-associated HD superfamily phosphohydrolase